MKSRSSFFAKSAAIAFAACWLTSCSHGPSRPQVHRPALGPRGRLEYDSSQLMMKSVDQANELIQKRSRLAGKALTSQSADDDATVTANPEAVAYYRDAMRIALSRPDQDGFRAAAFARLDRELADLGANATVLQQLADEGIGVLQSDDAATNVKATYVVMLDNLMAELKPGAKSRPWAKQIIENIRDARIVLTDSVYRQQLLRSMSRPASPSETAAAIFP